MIQKIFILLFGITLLGAQNSILQYEFGSFENASSFSFSNAGAVYVTDQQANTISKFDTSGNLILSIGGYGSAEESFDEPVHVFANTLNIYICDKNNSRLVFLDKDLNYLSELRGDNLSDAEFGYPIASGVSNQGDLFILDSDNARVLKFDLNGNYIMQIGNYDAGEFYLNNPTDLTITNSGDIVVLDGNKILVFDQYGNGIKSFLPSFDVKGVNFNDGYLLLFSDSQIQYFEWGLNSLKANYWSDTKTEEPIRDAAIFNSHIYILTSHSVKVYPFDR